MGKKERIRKALKKEMEKERQRLAKLYPTIVSTPAEKPKSWLVKFLDKSWKIIVGIILLIGGFAAYEPVCNIFKSDHQKYRESTFIEGDLKPPKINSNVDSGYYSILENQPIYTHARNDSFYVDSVMYYPPEIKGILIKNMNPEEYVHFFFSPVHPGAVAFIKIKDLLRGVRFKLGGATNCGNQMISCGIKDDRLYVSTEFKDLQNGELIGSIEFNHWKLFKPNLLDYDDDDERLEVRDKKNYIVFNIKYFTNHLNLNTVYIGGYFIEPESITILTNYGTRPIEYEDTCYLKSDSLWKQKAEKSIQSIHSVFK